MEEKLGLKIPENFKSRPTQKISIKKGKNKIQIIP